MFRSFLGHICGEADWGRLGKIETALGSVDLSQPDGAGLGLLDVADDILNSWTHRISLDRAIISLCVRLASEAQKP
jgi:hypothetical protein